MNEELQAVLAEMNPLLINLKACPPETFNTRTNLPNRGVYVFYEHCQPLYVGRSNDIWKRIRQHGVRNANHGQANFAFRLLAREYNLDIGHGAPLTRAQIAQQYEEEFRQQKERVRDMQNKAVGIIDHTQSYFFEAYAILALGTTDFNRFEPH